MRSSPTTITKLKRSGDRKTVTDRRMHLNFHGNSAGEHFGAWRLPADGAAAVLETDFYIKLAQTAERGLFDGIFYAAGLALHEGRGRPPTPGIDPVVLAAVLAANTERIGLVVTASTTFNEPYNVARTIASLDHVSQGRAAWNIVTTYDESAAKNFGMNQLPPKDVRYDRAREFVDVVLKLWDSWEPGALTTDAYGAVRLDADFIHRIDFTGRYYTVRGPGLTPPSPQGRPVLFQAGASQEGKAFAASTAEGIFSVGLDFAGSQAFYAEMKRRVRDAGRDPNRVKILPGLYLYIGSTEAEAARVLEADSTTEDALAQLAVRLSASVEDLELDQPVAPEILERAAASAISLGHATGAIDVFRRERLTVREFLVRQPVRGPHRVFVGTPETVASTLEQWFLEEAADGFNIGNLTHAGLELFVDEVVPILQRRGLYRREYAGSTLREHLFGP
jgi:FMN-dependent oxidoreductase (nitrilotriacetate monooxygenase family)